MASKLDDLRTCLAQADFDAVQEFAREHKRTLSFLTALTYDLDSTICWRAIEAIGLAASQIAKDDPEHVHIHLRRLMWLLNDESGGIGWRAPEVVGEILYHEPIQFSDFIPILVNLLDMEPGDAQRFRAGWLWAVGRLAVVCPDQARTAQPWVCPCLDDPDPQVRGMAVWCLAALELPLPEKHQKLRSDQGRVDLYNSPDITTMTVAEMVSSFSI